MEPGACLPNRKACPPTGYLGTLAQAAASQAGWSLRRRTRPRPPCHQLCGTDARRCHRLLPPWAPRGARWPADMRRLSCGGVWRPWPLACSSPSSSFCAPAVTGESQPPAGPPGTPVPRGTPPSHAGPPPTHTHSHPQTPAGRVSQLLWARGPRSVLVAERNPYFLLLGCHTPNSSQ